MVSLICSAYSHAANQGVFGKSSTGSISVSVTIPETVRLFASHVEVTTSEDPYACIQIMDRGAENNSLHYYRVKQAGISQTENLYKIKNNIELNTNLHEKCNSADSLIKLESHDVYPAKASVLMLVPE